LPIIASTVGGMPEALGNAGMIIKPEDPKALANAIKYLVGDNEKRNELSRTALQRSKLFTEAIMLEQTQEIYRQITKASR
jgi:glycosyltransferase involved in cell wall biosynthesis